MDKIEKLERLLRHIELVRDNCIIIAKKMMQNGEEQFARELIANSLKHDNSKFFGIEWEVLTGEGGEILKIAIDHHNLSNKHHPEYWGSIKEMPRLFLAEMVADWKARSTEFGSSLIDWIDGEAAKRFGFTKEDEVYENIMEFVNLLCDRPFVTIVKKRRKPIKG
jgi:hypothetical protein